MRQQASYKLLIHVDGMPQLAQAISRPRRGATGCGNVTVLCLGLEYTPWQSKSGLPKLQLLTCLWRLAVLQALCCAQSYLCLQQLFNHAQVLFVRLTLHADYADLATNPSRHRSLLRRPICSSSSWLSCTSLQASSCCQVQCICEGLLEFYGNLGKLSSAGRAVVFALHHSLRCKAAGAELVSHRMQQSGACA